MIKKIIKIALIIILFAISILIFSKCNYAEMVDFNINKIEPKGLIAYNTIKYSNLVLIEILVFMQIYITIGFTIIAFSVHKKNLKKKLLCIILAIFVFLFMGYIAYYTIETSTDYVSSTIDSPPSKIKFYLLGHGEVYLID